MCPNLCVWQDLCRRLQGLRVSLGGLLDDSLPPVALSGLQRRGVLQLQQALASLVPADPRAMGPEEVLQRRRR